MSAPQERNVVEHVEASVFDSEPVSAWSWHGFFDGLLGRPRGVAPALNPCRRNELRRGV